MNYDTIIRSNIEENYDNDFHGAIIKLFLRPLCLAGPIHKFHKHFIPFHPLNNSPTPILRTIFAFRKMNERQQKFPSSIFSFVFSLLPFLYGSFSMENEWVERRRRKLKTCRIVNLAETTRLSKSFETILLIAAT
jgi:hypothetical protein